MHSINLAVRFVLEVLALIAMGVWGWRQSDESFRLLVALAIPIVLAIVWGTFNVPGDPSRGGSAPIVVSGVIRLIVELGIFAVVTWALYNIGYTKLSLFFIFTVVVHYIVSYERIMWLLVH